MPLDEAMEVRGNTKRERTGMIPGSEKRPDEPLQKGAEVLERAHEIPHDKMCLEKLQTKEERWGGGGVARGVHGGIYTDARLEPGHFPIAEHAYPGIESER
jgi:hypothetical protein